MVPIVLLQGYDLLEAARIAVVLIIFSLDTSFVLDFLRLHLEAKGAITAQFGHVHVVSGHAFVDFVEFMWSGQVSPRTRTECKSLAPIKIDKHLSGLRRVAQLNGHREQ